MSSDPRKKSPRAPSIPLGEAIERAFKIYDKERRHAVPVDIVAQDIGYKSANNGAALSALASLRYFGLLDRSNDGKLAVTKDVEDYKFSPTESLKREIEAKWLKAPPIFAELLEKFSDGLPSDAVLRFELIQRGFNPSSAESAIKTFKESVEFVRYFENNPAFAAATESLSPVAAPAGQLTATSVELDIPSVAAPRSTENSDVDRIPIRLSHGRRAWLEIPTPFFEADKARIKAQIDLLLTDQEGE